MQVPVLAAALALAAATAQAAPAPATYVALPQDGAVWGFDLDHPRLDPQGGMRVDYVMIDGEDPAVGDVRGDLHVDCDKGQWRTLGSGLYDPAGQPIGAASPVPVDSPLAASALGRLLATALCDRKPAPGPRQTLPQLHALHERQLR